MSTKILLNERKRLILLLLFYKNDAGDIEFYIKSIRNINQELKHKNYNKNDQFEYFLEKVLKEPTKEHKNRLAEKFIEIARLKN